MHDLEDICQNVRGDLMRVITKLSVLQSIDPDFLMQNDPEVLNKARNLLFGIKEVVDLVQKDIYSCVLELEK